jgi:hypothetical protein
MGRVEIGQFRRIETQLKVGSADGVPNVGRAIPPVNMPGGATIDLVSQVATLIEGIEAHAAETNARAHDLARRTVDQLNFATGRIRALEAGLIAAEVSLTKANARADEAEQVARITRERIAAIEDRLAAAEDRARNAEARAIEGEKALRRVDDAIRNRLLAKRQPSIGRLAAAA